jgi:hypothetical protein
MDAYVTANGVNVIRADIMRPRVGNWHADLTVDSTTVDAFTGAVEIIVAEILHLQGTAYRVGVHHDTVFLRVVGGKAGLGTMLAPRAWQNVPLWLALTDALSGAGETLSPTADAAALGVLLPKWMRPQRTAGAEVGALVQAAGTQAWRVLPDGTLWIGPEAWPAASLDFQEIEWEPSLGRLTFAADLPTVNPGDTWPAGDEPYSGGHVSSVNHVTSAGVLRHFVWFEDTGAAGSDRLKAGLDAYLATKVQPQIDALAGYWATVSAQNGDGTLELTPDSPRLPGLSGVPIRYGVPGVTATVPAGARCLVEFAQADLTKPCVTAWEPGTGVTTTVTASGQFNLNGTPIVLNGGSTPVAKEGSATVAHLHTGTAGPYGVTLVTAAPVIASGAGSPTVKVP